MGRFLTVTYLWARRCVIAVIGGTVIAIGVLMIVLPGPAFIVIPAGLAILGLEFAFARRWLKRLRTTGSHVLDGTLLRWFRKKPQPSQVHRFDQIRHQAHAIPPYARPFALRRPSIGRPQGVTTNTKAGYSRTP